MKSNMTKEVKTFQAETKQLLDLMINSIYINKEIFLRELVSNASDAIDKIRFQSLTNLNLVEGDSDFKISIDIDENEGTISVSDNGIGMVYDEVVENIGTIAKSGTKCFLERLQNKEDCKNNPEFIGQFGVGFYSTFIVADRVTLTTRASMQETGVRWESTGDGTYTIEDFPKEKRGTTVTLTLKDFAKVKEKPEENFLNRYTIQNLIKKYSDFIHYPITMDFYREEKPKDSDGKVIDGATPTVVVDNRVLNSRVPIWEKNKSDITSDEYFDFYKKSFRDWEKPLDIIHTKVEGVVEYTALLFIPSRAPSNFYSREYDKGLKLYSKSIFIMDNCREILPNHLNFVSGLVDSPDFSLNISREILQHNRQLKLIGKNLEKNILKTLETLLKNEREKYEVFWKEFGKAIKGSIYMDYKNKEKLQDLLMFPSSYSVKELSTLDEYVVRMPESQKEIYYAVGKNKEAIEMLPQMEAFQEKGYEVLYLYDKIDEFAIDTMRDFKDKRFKSISHSDSGAELHEEGKEQQDQAADGGNKDNEAFLKAIKAHLNGKVNDVRESKRLRTSAVCLVSGDGGISVSMEKLLAGTGQTFQKANRVLELNPSHEIFINMKKLFESDPDSPVLKDFSEILYIQASLIEGFELENPIEFANRVSNLMVMALK